MRSPAVTSTRATHYHPRRRCAPAVRNAYDAESAGQPGTPYMRAVSVLVAEIDANRADVFAGWRLSPDFEIRAVEHED